MKLRIYAMTQPGKGRRSNEDAVLVAPETGFFAVADGVGGNFSGEVAARTALAVMREHIRSGAAAPGSFVPSGERRSLLEAALKRANSRIYELGRSDENCRDMACTLAAGLLNGDELIYAHMGDSRLYLFRNGLTEQLTADHTWVREQIAQGRISAEEAKTHKMRGAVTKAVGAEETAEPDFGAVRLRHGDYVIFCTDGIGDAVQRAEIGDTVDRLGPKVRKIAESLADLAVAQGSADDIAVIVLHALKKQ